MWWVVSSSYIASNENSGVRPLLKVGLLVAVKAQSLSLAQGPLSVLWDGLKEMRFWVLRFLPWLTHRRWPEVRARLGLRWRSSGNGVLASLLFRTKERFS